ncbi:hypothetical protein KAJ02_11140 [Candidatus Bipolaricaulota bacterium]|nr:hypothetical protein [Candidatus Bipolaricaulota bacterium]MCK5586613.1 hypothetical protein [Candidatus Bipolaricaulota bacterium]
MLKRYGVLVGVMGMVLIVSLAAFGQDAPLVSEQVQEAAASALDQGLTYIDSAAKYLGQGALYIINLITNDRVSTDLEKPIGYLALITLILILFGLLDFARRVIWIGIIVGWVLLIVRIILDALNL